MNDVRFVNPLKDEINTKRVLVIRPKNWMDTTYLLKILCDTVRFISWEDIKNKPIDISSFEMLVVMGVHLKHNLPVEVYEVIQTFKDSGKVTYIDDENMAMLVDKLVNDQISSRYAMSYQEADEFFNWGNTYDFSVNSSRSRK